LELFHDGFSLINFSFFIYFFLLIILLLGFFLNKIKKI
jgi:hypothetical protein